ncbi:unnamed protein product [Lymnaea stagnalis]|uniref:Fanconi anemia core complex-associated protein 24 pseudonuclease domain-containing protein n=1 Tax=Lymnaea stagnalis TaxID=6523 RepID=A0AAV2HIK3_LYMST
MNNTQTIGIKVPVGHITANSRWTGSNLVTILQASIPVQFESSTSAIDFYPSCNTGVVYISEAEIVEGCAFKRKVARLRKASKVHGIVVVEKTVSCSQYFPEIQKFCVSDLGLDLIPVNTQAEAAGFLVQLVYVTSRLDRNPFQKQLPLPKRDPAVLAALTSCPGLGKAKATALLEKFPSIHVICQATQQELAAVLGKASALKLYNFFHSPT